MTAPAMRFTARVVVMLACLLTGLVAEEPGVSRADDGAAYEGTHEAGGPVRMVVVGEPARITSFEIEGVAGGGCSWDTITLANWGGEIALNDGRFEAINADGDTLAGARLGETLAERRIEGSIQVHDPAKGCETPPLRWVAVVVTAP